MLFSKILKKDIQRNKIITATLFAFILLAALLVSSAAGMLTELFGSMNNLYQKADGPHFVQMHSGAFEQSQLEQFAANNELVKKEQIIEMLNINGAHIVLGNNETSEANSIMENAFVKQAKDFDYLLDMDNQVLEMQDGEVAVPLYHMQQYGLKLGDKVTVSDGSYKKEFIITAFARDVLMNASMLNSKRFLISDHDWDSLKENLGEAEYLIEFQMNDVSKIRDLETSYQNSGMPKKGTAITYSLYMLINALTDGIVAAVIIFISILLIIIAALCLRFTIAATLEEDYKEIGGLKAIGISNRNIRKLYLIKYVSVAAAATVLGYIISLFVRTVFTANIALYMGKAEVTPGRQVIPIIGSAVVFGFVVLFCWVMLSRFKKVSAVEAIRTGGLASHNKSIRGLRINKSKLGNVNLFLGIREVIGQFRSYWLLCFIFVTCSFLMIVPINFLTTLKSPQFISYMGAGECDVRVDLQQTADVGQRYAKTIELVKNDSEITKYSALFTSIYPVINKDGEYENLKVEVGDFTVFPLEYTNGKAPIEENEIALSSMNANELEKNIGDKITLLVGGENKDLTVCGIYQDVTNGGKTAKAMLPYDADNIIWFTINMNVADGVDVPTKIKEYEQMVYPAKVSNVSEYVYQTLGNIIDQLGMVTVFAFGLSLAMAVLITAMFFKMLLAKDNSQIIIMRSLGFSVKDVRIQYITRALTILVLGILIGTLAAGTIGEKLAGAMLSGASSIQFVVNPIMVYLLCPLSLIVIVAITILISSMSIKSTSNLKSMAE